MRLSIMETKEQLIKSIQEWVKNDNEIRQLNSEIKTRKNAQKRISKDLMDTMRTNEIDEFDISNGKIKYSKRSVRKPITKKGLLSILSKYCKGDIEFMLLNHSKVKSFYWKDLNEQEIALHVLLK